MPRFVVMALWSLVFLACNGSTDPDDAILRYQGSANIESETPIVIAGVVTVRNTSQSIVTIERNACPELKLYDYASSSTAPAWRSETACDAISIPLDLAPGNAYAFPVKAELPSNLKNGLYYLAVVNQQWRDGVPITLVNLQMTNGKPVKWMAPI